MEKSRYGFNIRHRLNFDADQDALYKRAFDALSALDPPWGFKGLEKKPLTSGAKTASSVGVGYTRELGAPNQVFSIGFRNRHFQPVVEDSELYDDLLISELNLDHKKIKVDYAYMLRKVFPTYVDAMDAYVGFLSEGNHVYNRYIAARDAPSTENADVGFRHGVDVIWPANFWDRELCRRAFKLTPEQVVERVSAAVAEARVFKDGALVIYSYERLPNDDMHEIEATLRPLLDKP